VLVRLRHPGETMGYRDFFSGAVFTTSAEALAPTKVCFIRDAAVRSLLERNPSLGLRFLEQVSHDLQSAEDTILQTASLATRARLAHLLLTLKDRHGTVGDDGDLQIALPLSRQDIADLLGTRPETIARVINALEKDGVAVFSGRMVIVPDLDALLDEIEPAEGP
jgi:CRP/FNR family transcriptional regulator